MTAKELINPNIVPLGPGETVETALAQMDDLHLMHFPLSDGSEYTGLVFESDLLNVSDPDLPASMFKSNVGRIYVPDTQHIYEVIRLFAGFNLTLLPVLNEKNQYIGAITLSALVGYLPRIAAVSSPGGIIILEINSNDFLMTEIAQIVESNDTKILSMYVTEHPDSTLLEVTLKVNRIDIGSILQTFFRYNYTVKASWSQEDSYTEGLKDRYDALMNYLSI